jgi:hypothetical protein
MGSAVRATLTIATYTHISDALKQAAVDVMQALNLTRMQDDTAAGSGQH